MAELFQDEVRDDILQKKTGNQVLATVFFNRKSQVEDGQGGQDGGQEAGGGNYSHQVASKD